MYNVIVGLFTLLGFTLVVLITGIITDVFERRIAQSRAKTLNQFMEMPGHNSNRNLISLIKAELYSRVSMHGEMKFTSQHKNLLDLMARNIYILTKANVRNQIDLFHILVHQLNRQTTSITRTNVTTNNRVELIIEPEQGEPALCVRFHSVNALF